MSAQPLTTKLLDATSGESSEFVMRHTGLTGKWVITGTASAAIKIFEIRGNSEKDVLYKAVCSSWNGASVALHLKSSHADDSFSDSGVSFSSNLVRQADII